MNLSIFDPVAQVDQKFMVIDETSIYKAFEQVKDGRKEKGKRSPLALILTLILLGKMAGETTIHGIVEWVRERKPWVKKVLNWPKDFPVNATYSQALAKCSGEEIAQALAHVLLKAHAMEHCGEEPSRLVPYAWEEEHLIHTAMDGKTLRGTLGHSGEKQPSVHLLSLYECTSGIVLAQRAVKSKENEITAKGALLHPLLIKGRIISTDALHTQKKWCAGVHAYQGYYLVTVKDHQPTVRQDLEDFFQDKELDAGEWDSDKKVHKGHGRLEVREIWTSTQMNEWFAKEWAGIAQVFMIRRSVKEGATEREEVVYGLTNLSRKQANAQRLLTLNQEHWRIENRLHYRRDVTDSERMHVRFASRVLLSHLRPSMEGFWH